MRLTRWLPLEGCPAGTYPDTDGLPYHNTKHIGNKLSHGPAIGHRRVGLIGVRLGINIGGSPIRVLDHLGGVVDARRKGQDTARGVHPQVGDGQPVEEDHWHIVTVYKHDMSPISFCGGFSLNWGAMMTYCGMTSETRTRDTTTRELVW